MQSFLAELAQKNTGVIRCLCFSIRNRWLPMSVRQFRREGRDKGTPIRQSRFPARRMSRTCRNRSWLRQAEARPDRPSPLARRGWPWPKLETRPLLCHDRRRAATTAAKSNVCRSWPSVFGNIFPVVGEHILQCRFEQLPHRIAIERIADQYDPVVAIQQKRLKPRVG